MISSKPLKSEPWKEIDVKGIKESCTKTVVLPAETHKVVKSIDHLPIHRCGDYRCLSASCYFCGRELKPTLVSCAAAVSSE